MFQINRQSIAEHQIDGTLVYLLVAECASQDVEVSSKVFVYHADAGLDGKDIFHNVASLQDLSELPEDAPDNEAEGATPFYRDNTLHLVAYHVSELEGFWSKILADLSLLKASVLASRDLGETETLII